MIIIPYNEDIIQNFKYDGIELSNDDDLKSIQETVAYSEKSFIGLKNSVPVCVFGIFTIHSGVGYVWGYFNKDLCNYPLNAVRKIRDLYKKEIVSLGYHRVQCMCKSELPKAGKFALCLGFGRETTLHQYGTDKEDYILYYRLEDRQ